MGYTEDYRQLRKLIEGATKDSQGTDSAEVAWTVVEGVSAVIDGATGGNVAGLASGSLKSLYDGISAKKSPGMTPNPWFVFNGHADDDSPVSYTHKYLRNRAYKGLAGGLFGLIGTGSSQVTQVDVAGILMHSNAVATTSIHLIQLKAIGDHHKQSKTLSGWVNLMVKMKALKAGVRGSQLAGAAIPVGAVGIATGVAAAVAKICVHLTHTKVCAITAADIHWRAYQEQAISGGLFGKRGKVGPASNMMYEMFCKRGATRIFGKYDVDQIIKEPTGWMCLHDKLMLI